MSWHNLPAGADGPEGGVQEGGGEEEGVMTLHKDTDLSQGEDTAQEKSREIICQKVKFAFLICRVDLQ